MMKKIITVLFFFVMILGLVACGNSENQTEQPSAKENSSASDVNDTLSEEKSDTDDTEDTDVSGMQGKNILVAYFSATNTTEGVAKHIADGLNADIYEIVPEEPYTEEDLNYNDNESRTTIEMNDPDVRPVISGSVENMEQYDIVFIGYPICLAYHNLIQCTQA